MNILRFALLVLTFRLCLLNISIAQPFPSDSTTSTYEIQARIRNGNTGFESGLFTPSTPPPGSSGAGQVIMNPAGAPIWNTNGNAYGDLHTFYYSYDAFTGTSVWKIDFNRDNDYNDDEETKTNIAATLAGLNFKYVDLRVQGSSLGLTAIVTNFTINGVNFGTLAANNDTAVNQTYEDSSGFFQNLVVTGSFSIGGNGGSERPRIWVGLGEFSAPCTAVTPAITISANPSNSICQGTQVNFTASSVNGGATPNYQWQLDGTNVGINSDTYANSTLVAGNQISCIMTSSLSCVTNQTDTSNIISMTVLTLPQPVITGNLFYCSGDSTLLDAGTGYTSYTWSNGATTQTIYVLTQDTLVVQVFDGNCDGTSNPVVVSQAPLIDAGITPIGNIGLCTGDSVQISVPFNQDYSYLWSTGDTTSSLYVSEFSAYTVVVTDNTTGCSSSSLPNGTVIFDALPSDVNDDGTTNIFDLNLVLGTFNTTCQGCPTDINEDGLVNIFEFNLVLAQFGLICQ